MGYCSFKYFVIWNIVCHFGYSALMPRLRTFVPFHASTSSSLISHCQLRVLQFNMLADGLSGLRSDLGAFSRAKLDDVAWDQRKSKLLHEILQYDPDIITLQECDHYYDFFLPELELEGYDGTFAPKPASACLQVSENSDGCATFVKRNKLQIVSTETLTYSLSKDALDKKSTEDERKQNRPQNQVGLITVCELIADQKDPFSSEQGRLLPVIIATTHLKAMKNELGEKYRKKETEQLLSAVDRCRDSVAQCFDGQSPAIIITGDFNASPIPCSHVGAYASSVYPLIKEHPLQYRSVLNDDLAYHIVKKQMKLRGGGDFEEEVEKGCDTDGSHNYNPNANNSDNIWTTWKARMKKGQEKVIKHCIDYILYSSPHRPALADHPQLRSVLGVQAMTSLDLFEDKHIDHKLFPSPSYPSDHIAIVADLKIVENRKNYEKL